MIGLEWICSELPDHHPAAQPKVGERRAAAAPAPQPMTDGEAPDIGAMSVKELRAHIAAAGLSCVDCVEKDDLRARAREATAAMQQQQQQQQQQGPSAHGGAADPAGSSSQAPVEVQHPCPVCLERSEDFMRGEKRCLFCSTCGHSVCCECKGGVQASGACPQCRAAFDVDDETRFSQLTQLLERPPGKHTAAALLNLGLCYQNGEGTPRDPAQALSCWRRAADCEANSGGSSGPTAMYNLGAAAYDARPEEAMAWFAKAAQQRHTEAMVDLANMLMERQEFSLARRLWLAAADEGHGEAERALAVHYSNPNELGERDFLAAYRYISRACVASTTPERMTAAGMQAVMQAKEVREQLMSYVEVRYELGSAYLAGTEGHWTSNYPLMKQPPLLEAGDRAMARKWLGSAAEAGHEEAAALCASMGED